MTDDLCPILHASIAYIKARKAVEARKQLKSARLTFQLARLELLRAVKDLESMLPNGGNSHERL